VNAAKSGQAGLTQSRIYDVFGRGVFQVPRSSLRYLPMMQLSYAQRKQLHFEVLDYRPTPSLFLISGPCRALRLSSQPLPPYPRVRATYVYDQLGFCSFSADLWVADLDCGLPATYRHPFCL